MSSDTIKAQMVEKMSALRWNLVVNKRECEKEGKEFGFEIKGVDVDFRKEVEAAPVTIPDTSREWYVQNDTECKTIDTTDFIEEYLPTLGQTKAELLLKILFGKTIKVNQKSIKEIDKVLNWAEMMNLGTFIDKVTKPGQMRDREVKE